MDRILGNEELKKYFRTAVRNGTVSHAYILEGEKGSGKKLIARALSRLLQCETPIMGPEGLTACGRCRSCIMMEHRDHPDVLWVGQEKAGTIGVHEVREQMVSTVDIMPYKGPWKIYIIDEAERMTPAAQNAALKTIEEPPRYAVIFLLTANRGAFLPTIRSRCVLLSTRPVPDRTVIEYLTGECGIPEEKTGFPAAFAMGNIGRARQAALSAAFSGLKETAFKMLREIHTLRDYEIISRIRESGSLKDDFRDYLDILTIWFRDILVLKALGDESQLIFKEEAPILGRQAKALNCEGVNDILEEIRHTEKRLRANVNFEAAVEMLHISIKNRFREESDKR